MKAARGVALLSVYDKTGVVTFGKGLSELGWEIYASGGTARKLAAAGIEVKDVSELVGGEAILGHRVVTLSRQIHAGLLADNSVKQQAELKRLGIPRIDLVCVDMYPLRQAISSRNSTEDAVIELTDVGGPTLLHAAAKGRRIVLSRPEQRPHVLEWLKAGKPDEKNMIKKLAATAELEAARYFLNSAEYMSDGKVIGFIGEQISPLRYGENPWQRRAGIYGEDRQDDSLSLSAFGRVVGDELSVTNCTDIDRLLQTITHVAAGFDRNYGKVPAIALGAKHGNVCGAAVDDSPEQAVKNMLEGDPRAIFGGSIMCNFAIDKNLATMLKTYGVPSGKRFIDIVVAPEITSDALEILHPAKSHLRALVNPALADINESSLDTSPRWRYVRGGMLLQDNYTFVFDFSHKDLAKAGRISAAQKRDLVLAWAVGSTSNSNTISIVKNGMLLGNGVGQQDRVSAAQLAVNRAREAGHGSKLKGASAYSDSFFPFADAPECLARAGVSAILTTSGSVRDQEVIDAMKQAKVAFYTLPDAEARGFFAH